MRDFERLAVWQKAHRLTVDIYAVTTSLTTGSPSTQ